MAHRTIRQLSIVAFILSTGLYAGCAGTGSVNGFHTHVVDESNTRVYSRILVISLLKDTVLQQAQEREASGCLGDYGLTGVSAYQLFRYDHLYSSEEFDSVVAAADVEAILFLRPAKNGQTWLFLPPQFHELNDSVTGYAGEIGAANWWSGQHGAEFKYGEELTGAYYDDAGLAGWCRAYRGDLFDLATDKLVWWSSTDKMYASTNLGMLGALAQPETNDPEYWVDLAQYVGCQSVITLKMDSLLVGGKLDFRGNPRTRR